MLLLGMELELEWLLVNMQNSIHTWKTQDMETHFDILFPSEVDSLEKVKLHFPMNTTIDTLLWLS